MGKWKVFGWVFAGLGALLIAAAEISPEQAVSNLSGWAIFLGISDVPGWLASDSADTWGMVIGIIVVLGSLTFIFIKPDKAGSALKNGREIKTLEIPSGPLQALNFYDATVKDLVGRQALLGRLLEQYKRLRDSSISNDKSVRGNVDFEQLFITVRPSSSNRTKKRSKNSS